MEAEKQKGVFHAGKSKSLSSGNAYENERRGWTEESYRLKNSNPINNYDWSRRKLNFEIVNGKIVPLGKQKKSLYRRYHDALDAVNYKAYKDGSTNEQNTYVELILSGSTETMQKLAFGTQEVNYERNPEEWHNWQITRCKEIEQFALESYEFACEQFGKENIIGFEAHLDETEPHIHVNLVPTAWKKQRGQVGGYIKIDENGNDVRYTKGKHIGEVIKLSEGKYNALSDEKKKQYRKNERGTVRTISYATYFGSSKKERSEKMSELHTLYYEKVGKKWGLERGDVWKLLSDDEKAKRRHKTKKEAYEEKLQKQRTEAAREERQKEEEKTQKAKAEAQKWGKMLFKDKTEEFASLAALQLEGSDFKTELQNTLDELVALCQTPKQSILQSDKEWKKQQQKKAKEIVTRLNDRLFSAKGLDYSLRASVKEIGKTLYADAKKEIADVLEENKRLKEEAGKVAEKAKAETINEILDVSGLKFNEGEATAERIGKAWREKFDKARKAEQKKAEAVEQTRKESKETIDNLKKQVYVCDSDGYVQKNDKWEDLTWQEYAKGLEADFKAEKKKLQETIADKVNEKRKHKEELEFQDKKHQEHLSMVKNVIFAMISGNMKEAVYIILQQLQKDMEDFVKNEADKLGRFIFGDANDIESRRIFVSNSFVWARVLASVEQIDYKESSFNSLQQDALRVADGTWQSWRDEKEKLFTDAVDAILELGTSASQKHFNQDQAERIIRYANHIGNKPFDKVTEELWQEAKPQIPDYWRGIAADAVKELDEAVEKQIEMQRSKGMGGR